MKKFLAGALLSVSALTLAACGDEKSSQLVVGASNVPHAVILEEVKPILEEQGIELVIESYQDYVLPNKDLDSGDLDANYFQHIPYFESQKADFGYDFAKRRWYSYRTNRFIL